MAELTLFYPEGHAAHRYPGHPERPERVEAIRRAFEESGRWQPAEKLLPLEVPVALLESVHTPDYLERLKSACQHGMPLDADTYTTPASWELALQAVGGGLATAKVMWEQPEQKRCFAWIRPPGHHATRRRGMGFCLLNNVAVAAEYLLQEKEADRLAIIDLDLHHGNGTQDIFYRRSEVVYFSTHQAPFYPGSGWIEETGEGDGKGFTVNLPLPAGSGDRALSAALDDLILPLLDRFRPQALLVEVGFDVHWRDPLGSLLISAGQNGRAVQSLNGWAKENCNGRIALFLEGGYDLDACSVGALACAMAILDEPIDDPLGPAPQTEGRGWMPVLEQARKVWSLL